MKFWDAVQKLFDKLEEDYLVDLYFHSGGHPDEKKKDCRKVAS